jgi:hypothetical protein
LGKEELLTRVDDMFAELEPAVAVITFSDGVVKESILGTEAKETRPDTNLHIVPVACRRTAGLLRA